MISPTGRKLPSLRVMTYNVHGCRGGDGRLKPERIVQVIASAAPDVVALQELDVGRARSRSLDQTAFLAQGLGMHAHFVSARPCDDGHYGNAILTRLPSRAVHTGSLPRLDGTCEQRAAQWVRVDSAFGPVDVLNAHFGLRRDERALQTADLLGPEWCASPELGARAVLCGDLNSTPRSFVYSSFSTRLRDAQLAARRGRASPTFPALLSLVRIDHVFVTETLAVERVDVPSSLLARVASDHRPLVVDLAPAEARA